MCRQLVKLREILFCSVERGQIAGLRCCLHLLHRLIRLIRLASYGLAMLLFFGRLHKNRRQLRMTEAGSVLLVHIWMERLVLNICFQAFFGHCCLLGVAQLFYVWFLLRFNFAIVLVTDLWLIIWNFADTIEVMQFQITSCSAARTSRCLSWSGAWPGLWKSTDCPSGFCLHLWDP